MKLQEHDVIESRLIWCKHYDRWTNEIIMALDKPPGWVLEIAAVEYFPKAVEIIREFVYSEPLETFDDEQYTDEYVACLFLRYERGEIAWATFLNEAGQFTDCDNGHRHCEYFYYRLNDLEDKEYSKSLERSQRAEIEREFAKAIDSVQALYKDFLEYFRLYVAK